MENTSNNLESDSQAAARTTPDQPIDQNPAAPEIGAGRSPSCLNARSHGLSARILSGPEEKRMSDFFTHCRDRFGPDNALEEIAFSNMLKSRSWLDRFSDIERGALLHLPIAESLTVEPYPILNVPKSVAIFGPMARHFLHHSRIFEKTATTLVATRPDQWGPHEEPIAPDRDAAKPIPDVHGLGDARPINRGSLADLLADWRLIFPGEAAADFAVLAQGLWAAFTPLTLLEAFVVVDFVIAEWRIQRIERLQNLVFERLAVTAFGDRSGPETAFISDFQQSHALEPLQTYENALRRHQEKRGILFRKLRAHRA